MPISPLRRLVVPCLDSSQVFLAVLLPLVPALPPSCSQTSSLLTIKRPATTLPTPWQFGHSTLDKPAAPLKPGRQPQDPQNCQNLTLIP